MAKKEHLDLLKQGADIWNLWRKQNPNIIPDLSAANLSGMDLRNYDLSKCNLKEANLTQAKLWKANLKEANLTRAKLCFAELTHSDLSSAIFTQANMRMAEFENAVLKKTDLSHSDLWNTKFKFADLSQAILTKAELSYADFWNANLYETILYNANLTNAKFSYANLGEAILYNANLCEAILCNADLTNANLSRIQALGTDFTASVLTGACLEDWSINSETKLDNISCKYVYLKTDKQDRIPKVGEFGTGEFTRWFQTIDLNFPTGIDWSAFYFSFKELKVRHKNENLSLQAIENKNGSEFVIRLEGSAEADKLAVIKSQLEALYQTKIQEIETQYQTEIKAKKTLISKFKTDLEYQRQANTNLLEIVKTMAERGTTNKTEINANNVGFIQSGNGTVSNFSQNIGQNSDEITKIISSLRDLAQEFPDSKREEAMVHLDDLQEDISKPEKRKPERIKTRIVALLTIAGTIAGVIAGVTDFSNNVLELANKLNIPIEFSQSQQPTQQLPPSTLN
ncbi:pentapeptide repeat-containing protein [Nostoc sp. LEGE 06077]|uniref:pentapeptide repeat-containing protein n=1 Tax=Nostoc sp. LEGE 06077 TaxID=915325 RepID=UPI001882301B|nr:pentapeptide repeat-containing protein [Nostoc sp. LEGE 06077]MBE9211067.1 pentapeptide repeat-containing protein [Nostoc sp. LEGE 06077]